MKAFDCANESLDRGVTLLEASAGTGKTYALARIFLRLVVEEGVEVGKLLTVTFTKAATEELRGRIRELLVDALASFQGETHAEEDPTITRLKKLESVPVEECIRRLRLAITCFDEAIISTIHGFCQRVLAENSLETNCLFEAELDQSSPALVAEAVRDYWRVHFSQADPLISAVASIDKIKPASVVEFYNKLPSTQEYEIGFSQGLRLEETQKNLFDLLDRLKNLWIEEGQDYLEFVATKIRKYTASKKAAIHRAFLDNVFLHERSITPEFVEIFEFVRASKLTLLKDYENEPKPEFSQVAEKFWDAIDDFSQTLRADAVNFIDSKISSWKRERGILSFDDLLSVTAKAVSRQDLVGESLRQSLRSSFQVAMIDEFQDTDPVQFTIFRELFAGTGDHWLFLIGDPKQSIYRFRGADLEAYFKFGNETGGQKYSLDTNYRTVTPLVKATNSFFAKSDDPFLHPHLKFQTVNPKKGGSADQNKMYLQSGEVVAPFEVRELIYEEGSSINDTEARRIIIHDLVQQVSQVLQEGEIGVESVKPEDIAILVRSNPQALEVWEAFRANNLPAVVFSDVSLFSSEEAKEILWVLEGLLEYRNERSVRRALATGLLGMNSNDFINWQNDHSSWEAWLTCFRQHHDMWRKDGIYVALISLFRRAYAVSQNLRRTDGERRVTNFLHLAEVLHEASSLNPLSPSSLIVWLRDQIQDAGNQKEEYQLRLESEATAIQILTVHKSKGLEYPVVFCPFLSLSPGQRDESFFYHDRQGSLVVELKNRAGVEAAGQGLLEEDQEDARVLYVALTRAASRCVLYHAPVSIKENKEAGALKIPALTRILRSQAWCEEPDLSEEEWKQNRIASEVLPWIEQKSLGALISFSTFDANASHSLPSWKELVSSETELSGNVWPIERRIPSGVLLRSFSALVEGIDFEGKDLDAVVDGGEVSIHEQNSKSDEIFEFPSGARAGNFMHEVFEQIDFTDTKQWEEVTSRALAKFGFDPNRWLSVILKMIHRVIAQKLGSGFSLSVISQEDRVEEMEFHFPIQTGRFSQLIESLPQDSLLSRYLQGVGQERVLEIESEGYLKGLMDLVFRHDGKYYLLDWKSNRLSGHEDDFSAQEIEAEMMDHHYILQYHLYLVGLIRFLKSRIHDFDYSTHFGGVYYLFVRGIGHDSGKGIFYDLPDENLVVQLDTFFAKTE